MKAKVTIALFVCILLIAAIAVPATGCKGKTTRIIHTPNPSIVATAEPTEEINPTETPEETAAPAETPEPTETVIPTATPSDATPTPTSEATPTSSPEPSPTPAPTDTAQPTATPTQPPASSPTTVSTPIPTPTPTTISTPAPSQTPVPNTVYFQTIGNQKVGSSFSIQVMIYQTTYFAQGQFDIRFDSNIISYVSTSSTSIINGISGTVSSTLDPGTLGDNGLLRITPIDYTEWAYQSNGGNGVIGSGYLCTITFSPIAAGTSSLNFVAGQGSPSGKLELVKWINYVDSVINPVYWINGSLTVVN